MCVFFVEMSKTASRNATMCPCAPCFIPLICFFSLLPNCDLIPLRALFLSSLLVVIGYWLTPQQRGVGEGPTLIGPDAFSVPAVHGVWEEWSPWSLCSFTCGRGHRTRTRMCAPPQHGGRACDGPETQTKLCNIALCPGIASPALIAHTVFFTHCWAELSLIASTLTAARVTP